MKNRIAVILACFITAFSVTNSHADLNAADLPSMGNLAKLLGTTDPAEVEANVYDESGKISAGMYASDSERGKAAALMAQTLADGDESKANVLTDAFNQTRVAFEDVLSSANFDVNDVGVSLAASFIVLWETASGVTLADESALNAGKFMVHAFSEAQADFDKIPELERAQMRDILMTQPVVFGMLSKAFSEQPGADEQVAMLRAEAEEMFLKLFRTPYDYWVIEADGSFNFNLEQVKQYQESNDLLSDTELSSDW